ncbi:hypothetical protein BD779DRAFT_1598340 [Infundibulicybe gibba]|nr:hypothetical protein BD779DRAFT_1598340 [Infundibulicybe gibba]
MGVWFPDNINRRDRAQQLSNDITMMQNDMIEAKAGMDRRSARMVPYINEVLRNHGMSTFDDLKARLDATLAPEQQRAYEKLVQISQGTTESNDKTLTILSIIVLCSGSLAQDGAALIVFLACGHIASVFRAYATFVVLITKGVEAGNVAFQAIRKSAKLAADVLNDQGKLANCAAWASQVLEIIAICGIATKVYILGASVCYCYLKLHCYKSWWTGLRRMEATTFPSERHQ